MRLLTAPIALVLAAGLATGGCGGGDDSPSTTTAPLAPTITSLATTTPAAPAKPGSAEEAARRLRAGGYTVRQLDVNPPPTAARKVGDHVLLYEYKTPAAARAGALTLKAAIKENPDRGLTDVADRLVYFLGEAHAITAAERASFADLVDVGEGR